MRDRCTRAGARFLMTGTIADNAAGGEAGLPHDLEWLDIPFLNPAPALQPWQPWSYLEKSEGVDGGMTAVEQPGELQIRRVVASPGAGSPVPVGQTGRIH